MLDRRQFVSLASLLAAGGAIHESPLRGAAETHRIEKFRLCDGACCRRSPLRRVMNQFDGEDDCEFRDPLGRHDVDSSCLLMEDPKLLEKLTDREARRFIVACIGYPQVYPSETMGEKDAKICCWRNCD